MTSKNNKAKGNTKTEEKKIPYHYKPDDMPVDEWQKILRQQFGKDQDFTFDNIGEHPVFSDFNVFNPQSGKTYKVALRGTHHESGNFCNCPDFTINTLGTCKHIEFLLYKLSKKHGYKKWFREEYLPPYSSLYIQYGENRTIRFRVGTDHTDAFTALKNKYCNENGELTETSLDHIEDLLCEARNISTDFRCYPDVMDLIIEKRDNRRRRQLISQKYESRKGQPALDNLLNATLYPYQKEGILFALKAGRALLGDDMGLGKTIQSIGTAELLRKEFNITGILIVCPTSLKYQWQSEIRKFTGLNAQVIEGGRPKRKNLYKEAAFYRIISYGVVLHDLELLNALEPDLVILDEAQRIKNWKTKTSQKIKQLRSPYALVLTGTPLENKLEELHSIVEFIDRYRLGPMFKFVRSHQITDEHGKVIGYQDLSKIKDVLSPVLLRRTRKEVLSQLPAKNEQNLYVNITEEQENIHYEYSVIVSRLVNKWKQFRYLSEQDRQRLMVALNCMRMVADSTYILDQETRHDTKPAELEEYLGQYFENNPDNKIVIFSQWERMNRIVARMLEKMDVSFFNFHGGVSAEKRGEMIRDFNNDPKVRVFLSTDAGGIGLNLQAASCVINMDLPWNPAVLNQRIARVYRMGQKKHVEVINFVSKHTIEERMVSILAFKKDLFSGVLDNGEDFVFMDTDRFSKFMDSLKELNKSAGIDTDNKEEESLSTEKTEQIVEEGVGILEKISNFTRSLFSGKKATEQNQQFDPDKLVSSLTEKDDTTGKTYLKIPVKDSKLLKRISKVIESFMGLFR